MAVTTTPLLGWAILPKPEIIMRIWFVIAVGKRCVCCECASTDCGYAEMQKKRFREEGTPVLAIVRPKLNRTVPEHSAPQVQYDELVPVIPHRPLDSARETVIQAPVTESP